VPEFLREERIGPHRVILGDSRTIVPAFQRPESIRVISDPPYGIRNNNNYSRLTGTTHGPASSRRYVPLIDDDIPFDPSFLLRFKHLTLWGYPYFAGTLPPGTTLIWIKKNPPAFGKFLSDAEVAWQSGGVGVYCKLDLSNNALGIHRSHPTEKPVSLMRWCIDRVRDSGETVLDPFLGTGATGVAAVQAGRKFIGIEIVPEYFEIACRRIREAYNQSDLFFIEPSEGDGVTETA